MTGLKGISRYRVPYADLVGTARLRKLKQTRIGSEKASRSGRPTEYAILNYEQLNASSDRMSSTVAVVLCGFYLRSRINFSDSGTC